MTTFMCKSRLQCVAERYVCDNLCQFTTTNSIIIIIYITALPPSFDITDCNMTTFMCKSRLQCVAERYVCDNL